jgi:hypothetical protein
MFRDKTDAEQAIATMNGKWLGSRAIRVNWANQKTGGDQHSIAKIEESAQNLTLEELMRQKSPEDLTGQVTVQDFRRPAHGGFATVHKGEWNDKTVGLFLVLHTAL